MSQILVQTYQRLANRLPIAGFGYSFLNPKLEKYRLENRGEKTNYDEFSGSFSDFQQPLVNQPGEKFEYGVSPILSYLTQKGSRELTLTNSVLTVIEDKPGLGGCSCRTFQRSQTQRLHATTHLPALGDS